jgi:hypothetical protein
LSEATSITSFHANNNSQHYFNFDSAKWQDIIENLDTQEHAMKLHKTQSLIKSKMGFAQVRQQKDMNK